MANISILLCIDKLNRGGAERQLIEIADNLDKKKFKVHVLVLSGTGEYIPELLKKSHVTTTLLQRKPGWRTIFFVTEFLNTLLKIKPQVIYSFMGGTNELCLGGARISGAKIVWGIRASDIDFRDFPLHTLLLHKSGAFLSKFTDSIIANSKAGRKFCIENGYPGEKIRVVHNAIDTHRFTPKPESGRELRKSWGVGQGDIAIALIGRIVPKKDPVRFILAALDTVSKFSSAYFICAGQGDKRYKTELAELVEESGLNNRFIWAGQHVDMPALYNSIDILVSCSAYGEGFSNVVGEAMACAIPCIVTNVGDSAKIVGTTGMAVPPRDHRALANAIQVMADLPEEKRLELGIKARNRIVSLYNKRMLAADTERVVASLF